MAGARRRSTGRAVDGEVIVADNGSDDGSAELARDAGALRDPRAAPRLRQRLPAPASPPREGDYIVMADADLTYDFADIPRFVESSTRAPTS